MFTERPFMERFGAAAAAGFKAVELQFPYDHAPSDVKVALDSHGLTMLGLNAGALNIDGIGIAAVPGREQDFATYFKQALDYVVAIGGRSIHCLAGKVPPEQRPKAENSFVENLKKAAELAGKVGIFLLLEPINARDRPDYFLNRVGHAADIIAKVGAPNVKIQFDFYHTQIVEGDLSRRFEQYLPMIGHSQVGAVPSRHEPDEGEVNYPAIFEMIDRVGYQGWVAGEYRPRGRTEDGLAWARPYGVVPGA
jgi:hydroxypyruvate isomerase